MTEPPSNYHDILARKLFIDDTKPDDGDELWLEVIKDGKPTEQYVEVTRDEFDYLRSQNRILELGGRA